MRQRISLTKNKLTVAAALAILAVHMIVVLFYGMQKEAFHEDEYFTYYTSAGYEAINPWGSVLEETGYAIQSHFFVTDAHRFDFDTVVDIHSKDVHPPLYYLTLNFLMSLFPYQFYKWFGILLNSIYSLITCAGVMFFVYKLDRSKYRNVLAMTAGLIYAIHPAVLSSVMFTRMYSMSMMWTVLYMDVFVLLIQNYLGDKRKFAGITLCGALVCYLAFLTHYFCVYVPFFLTLGFCIYAVIRKLLYKEKGFLRMLIYGLALVAGIGMAILTFPASLEHIFSGYQGEGAFASLFDGNVFGWLIGFAPILNKNFFSGAMYPVLILFVLACLAGAALLYYRQKKGLPKHSVDFATIGIGVAAGLITVWLTSKTALFIGDPASRYFYNAAVLLIPLIVYVISKAVLHGFEVLFKKKSGMVLPAVLAVLFLLIPIVGNVQGNVLYLYRDKVETLAFARENAEYPLVMIYDQEYRYKTWYIANETWVYDKIVFIRDDGAETVIDNEALKTAEKLIVYMDTSEEILDRLVAQNKNLSSWKLLRHDLHYYVYVLE